MVPAFVRRTAFLCVIGFYLNDATKILKPLATPETMNKLSNSINAFGIDLYKLIIKEDDNIVFSPFGISLLLSALLVGARGKTATEINQTLYYQNLSLEEMLTAFHDIFIKENLVGYEMEMYKAMFFKSGVQIESTFGDVVGKMLMVEGKSVDFTDPESSAILNKHVKDRSDGKIPKLFPQPCDPSTELLLVNAMTFKGIWSQQFDAKLTTNGSFYDHGESKPKPVFMMHIQNKFLYVDNDDLEASFLKLPYDEENGHMIIALPRTRKGLGVLEHEITLERLQTVLDSMKPTEVEVSLPKFKIRNTFGMKPVLEEMGLEKAFDKNRADFFGLIGVDGISLTDVHQQNQIELNENGTDAASGAGLIPRSQGTEMASFTVNHPFLYFIQDKATNIIFFMGHILQM